MLLYCVVRKCFMERQMVQAFPAGEGARSGACGQTWPTEDEHFLPFDRTGLLKVLRLKTRLLVSVR